jgi:hypothetical protein
MCAQEEKAERERLEREKRAKAKQKAKDKVRSEKERLAAEREAVLRGEEERKEREARERKDREVADRCVWSLFSTHQGGGQVLAEVAYPRAFPLVADVGMLPCISSVTHVMRRFFPAFCVHAAVYLACCSPQ